MDIIFPKTTPRRYLTGMTALNIPSPEGTGDWHFHAEFFGLPPERPPHYKLSGIDLPDTRAFLAAGGYSTVNVF